MVNFILLTVPVKLNRTAQRPAVLPSYPRIADKDGATMSLPGTICGF
jgi:hypothetical protein